MKGSDVIATILEKEGVEHLTCFPHSEIIDAAAARGIRPILARTERMAVHMADGFSRMNDGRRVGVVTVQCGPGSENAFGAIAQAYGDASPILHLPTGYPRHQLGVAPNFEAGPNLRHVTKWSETINDVSRIPQMMQHAFALLRNGKPGPVALETPGDILNEECGDLAAGYTPQRRSAPQGDPRDVAEAVDALLAAEAPVILAGQGTLQAKAWDELRELAELLQIPVMTTLNGKSAFPEDHALALGTGALSRPATVDHFLAKADLVLGVGTSFTRSDYITPIPDGKTLVQITNTEADVSKDYPISLGAIGDAKAALGQMIAEVRGRLDNEGRGGGEAVAQEVAAVRAAFMAEWMPRLTSEEEPISPYRVVWDLMGAVDRRKTVVAHDAGNPRDQFVPFFEALVPHGYMGWGKTTQLGTSMGLMMGAKLARPDWLAVNVMGDAAFGMVGMDFETAVRCRIPILTIVMNNSLMGGYTHHLPVASERYEIHRLSGDYRGVAEALGGYAERVERVAELKPAILRAVEEVQAGRPALLEVITREETTVPKG